jgi:acetate kinase
VAVFDTSFHATISEMVYMYPIPIELSREHSIRKYGFHGTSYKYVCGALQSLLSAPSSVGKGCDLQVLVAHLGSGCSAAAVSISVPDSPGKAGRVTCRDTTMGFTPLDGLMMGTRSGSIDPSVVAQLAHIFHKPRDSPGDGLEGLAMAMDVLNKKSGLLGVSGGLTADMRDVIATASSPSSPAPDKERCQLSLDMFSHRAAREMMALTASLPAPVDCVVFTGGIGEKSALVRQKILGHMACCPTRLSDDANLNNESLISTGDSAVKVFVIPTNEELQIAKETSNILSSVHDVVPSE